MPHAPLAEPAFEPERGPFERLAAEREQEADRLLKQTPGHEGEREQRRRVEPLQVVNGDGDRSGLCRHAQRSHHGERDRGLIRRTTFRLGAVQRNGNRVPPYDETQDYVRKVLTLL